MPSYQYALGARTGVGSSARRMPELPLEIVGLEQARCGWSHADHDVAAVFPAVAGPHEREQHRLGRVTARDAVEPLDPEVTHVAFVGQPAREPVAQRAVDTLVRHALRTSRSDSSPRPSSGQSPVTMLSMIP